MFDFKNSDSTEVPKEDPWDVLLSSIEFPKWVVRHMSETPGLREHIKDTLKTKTWLTVPERPSKR